VVFLDREAVGLSHYGHGGMVAVQDADGKSEMLSGTRTCQKAFLMGY
jgi:hypothetical protein